MSAKRKRPAAPDWVDQWACCEPPQWSIRAEVTIDRPDWVDIASRMDVCWDGTPPPQEALEQLGWTAAWPEYARRRQAHLEALVASRANDPRYRRYGERGFHEEAGVAAFEAAQEAAAVSAGHRRAQRRSADARRDEVLWARIRADWSLGATIRTLEREHGVSRSQVQRICAGLPKGSLKK